MMRKIYVIDTSSISVLIRHYWGLVEGLKEKIENLINNGRLISSIEVFRELERYDDGHKWAKTYKEIFIPITRTQIKIIKEKIAPVEEFQSFLFPKGKDRNADPFLIAIAIEEKNKITLTETKKEVFVVTEEKLKGNKVKIPYVCRKIGLGSIDLKGMFKEEGWRIIIV